MNQEHRPSDNNQYNIPQRPGMPPQQAQYEQYNNSQPQPEQGKDKKKSRKGLIAGSVFGVVALAGAGGFAGSKLAQGGDNEVPLTPATETSAPAIPGDVNESVPTQEREVPPSTEITAETEEPEKSFTDRLLEESSPTDNIDPERTYIDEHGFAFYTGYSEEAIQEKITSLEIPDNLTPEGYALEDTERYEQWRNAGATDVNYHMSARVFKDGSDEGFTQAEWIQTLSEENTKIFAPAVFGEDWADHTRTNTLAAEMTHINADVLENYFFTKGQQGVEPYTQELEFTGMIPAYEGTNDERLIRFSMIMSATNDDSKISSELDGSTYDRTVTTKKVDGVEYATDWITERTY